MHALLVGWGLKLLVVVALVAAVFTGIKYLEHRGAKAERARWESSRTEQIATRSKIITELALSLSDVRDQLALERSAGRAALRDAERTYKDRLNDYVPPVPDRATCLRAGWVQYIDKAAAGMPLDAGPNTAGGATAPAQVGTDEAAAVIERNYFKYHQCVQTLADTVRAVDAMRAKFNAAVQDINSRATGAPD